MLILYRPSFFFEVAGYRESWSRDLYPLRCGQPNASASTDGDLVDVEAPATLLPLGSQSHRGCGTQNHILASPDPIPVPMAVQDKAARCMGRDRREDVGRIDEGEADPVGEADRGHRILHDLMVEQDHPRAMWRAPQNRLEGIQLRWVDDADGVGKREVAAGIRIEQD